MLCRGIEDVGLEGGDWQALVTHQRCQLMASLLYSYQVAAEFAVDIIPIFSLCLLLQLARLLAQRGDSLSSLSHLCTQGSQALAGLSQGLLLIDRGALGLGLFDHAPCFIRRSRNLSPKVPNLLFDASQSFLTAVSPGCRLTGSHHCADMIEGLLLA